VAFCFCWRAAGTRRSASDWNALASLSLTLSRSLSVFPACLRELRVRVVCIRAREGEKANLSRASQCRALNPGYCSCARLFLPLVAPLSIVPPLFGGDPFLTIELLLSRCFHDIFARFFFLDRVKPDTRIRRSKAQFQGYDNAPLPRGAESSVGNNPTTEEGKLNETIR